MRRRSLGLLFVLLISLAGGTRNANAWGGDCSSTACATKCIVFGEFGGFCNPPAEQTVGCIQLMGPDCASMNGAYCCRGEQGASF
jgi:hypothetical protein